MLHETQEGSSLRALANFELVGQRFDDRDPEPALGQLVLGQGVARLGGRLEALALVDDLDHELVVVELVEDLDRPHRPA